MVENIKDNLDIFLIEKGQIDPLENYTASGYKVFGYMLNEAEAIEFCESQGFWTSKDCWEIKYSKNARMPKYKYTKISLCK